MSLGLHTGEMIVNTKIKVLVAVKTIASTGVRQRILFTILQAVSFVKPGK